MQRGYRFRGEKEATHIRRARGPGLEELNLRRNVEGPEGPTEGGTLGLLPRTHLASCLEMWLGGIEGQFWGREEEVLEGQQGLD